MSGCIYRRIASTTRCGGTPGGTPGCGLDFAPGDSVVQTTVGATEREYTLVVPDGYDPSTPMPLVFAWHGRGGTSDLARLYFGVEQAAGGHRIQSVRAT